MRRTIAQVRLLVLALAAFVVQLLHLPCDMVVSGGNGLSDWKVQPSWPFDDVGYAFPLSPWGDVGPTVVLMLGALLLAKFPNRISVISISTLVCLLAYLLLRGWARRVL
jgi:hypothetical protein